MRQRRALRFLVSRADFGNDIVTFYHNLYPELDAENQQGRTDAGIIDFTNRIKDTRSRRAAAGLVGCDIRLALLKSRRPA